MISLNHNIMMRIIMDLYINKIKMMIQVIIQTLLQIKLINYNQKVKPMFECIYKVMITSMTINIKHRVSMDIPNAMSFQSMYIVN